MEEKKSKVLTPKKGKAGDKNNIKAYVAISEPKYGNIEQFEIERKIGRGRYADLYQGVRVKDKQMVTIKILKPIKKEKIFREVKILELLADVPHVSHFVDLVKDPLTKVTSIVMEYIEQQETEYKTLYKKFESKDIQSYMYQLLQALADAHAKGIMHRDVKPHNILYDKNAQSLTLIDWGQAEFFYPGGSYSTRVGALNYKAPELLLDYKQYNSSVDIWAAGCIFASLIFQEDPFFAGKDTSEQLIRICALKGSEEFLEYLRKLKIKISDEDLFTKFPPQPFSFLVAPNNQFFATKAAVDLVSKMLVIDHSARITAREALSHPYFQVDIQFQP